MGYITARRPPQDTVPCCHRPVGRRQNPRFIAHTIPGPAATPPRGGGGSRKAANAGPGFLAGPSGYSIARTPSLEGGSVVGMGLGRQTYHAVSQM